MKTANEILEAFKRLKGIKEDSQECEKCKGQADCKCDEEAPAVTAETEAPAQTEEEETEIDNPELEKEEPVDLQEDEEDGLEDARVFQVVMDKIALKPVQAKSELLTSLVNDLAGLINGLPSGEMKLRKLMTEFKKKSF